ncbi:MAG: MC/SLC25 family protein [Alphaproteobacteria bacterium]|nr:MC/SLC25 family protein [Alphaproteobacteria bacterium]
MESTLYLVFAALVGALRGAASLIVEHPLDVIKTYGQAYPDRRNLLCVAKEVHNLKGWFGFYSGAIPNVMRVMLKQAYRYPLMIALPVVFGTFTSSVACISIATGLSIAMLEVWVITPMERVKVWLMTYQKSSGGIKALFKALRRDAIHSLYKGLKITAVRQVASWVTFLVVHDQLMDWVKANNGNVLNMSLMMLLGISLIEGSINTVVVQPLDCIKTNQQKIKALSHDNMMSVLRHIYTGYGIRGFYVGWEVRMVQYVMNSGIMVVVLEGLKAGYG